MLKALRWILELSAPFVICGLAVLLKFKVESFVPHGMFPVLFLAVMFCAWLSGWRGGLIAAVLCALANAYFFIPPYNQFAWSDWGGLISGLLFTAAALLIVTLTSSLREAKQKAQDFASQKTTFVASVSHEIRNPINVIIGLTELLDRPDISTKERAHYLKSIRSSGSVLLSLINDILDLSKLSESKVRLENKIFDFRSEIQSASELIKNEVFAKGIYYKLEIDPSIPDQVKGDPNRLKQILWNLLSNAVKFTDQGGITLWVRNQSSCVTELLLEFEIQDTGIGIPKKYHDRLFEAFYRAGTGSTLKKGTGLGLSICKLLVTNIGGELTFSSSAGKGTSFKFTTILQFIEKDHTAETAPRILSQSIRKPGQKKILIVEDCEMNREVATGYVQSIGYEYESVSNGQSALKALKKEKFALVLTDCNMPEMDGYQLTHHLRKTFSALELPVIAMTAYTTPEDIRKCLKAGMNDHLSKPIQFTNFRATLGKWLKENPSPQLDSTLVRELSKIFVEQMPIRLSAIEKALEMPNFVEVSRLAHLCRSGAGILGLIDLTQHCENLENACQKSEVSITQATQLFRQLKKCYMAKQKILKRDQEKKSA